MILFTGNAQMADHSSLRIALEAKLQQLMERATDIETSLSDPGNEDWSENAVESKDDEVLATVGDLTKAEIHEIKLALSLIDSGHYGTCTACGKAISKDRLTAMPYATTCRNCA